MAQTIIFRNLCSSKRKLLYFRTSLYNYSKNQEKHSIPKDSSPATTLSTKSYYIDENENNFMQNIPKSVRNKQTSARRMVENFFVFLEEISHMDEVRRAQKNVINLKDKLKDTGDQKRQILFELNLIRSDIQKNHTEICNANRGTERYLTLVQEEMQLLKNETKKQQEFTTVDESERELFNSMTTAINDSYEKEKVHSNFIKMLGLLGTLTASIVTLIASAIGHYYHNTKFGLVAKDFKNSVNNTIEMEISSLKDVLRLDIASALTKIEKSVLDSRKKEKIAETESWASYLKRHSWNSYKYVIKKVGLQ